MLLSTAGCKEHSCIPAAARAQSPACVFTAKSCTRRGDKGTGWGKERNAGALLSPAQPSPARAAGTPGKGHLTLPASTAQGASPPSGKRAQLGCPASPATHRPLQQADPGSAPLLPRAQLTHWAQVCPNCASRGAWKQGHVTAPHAQLLRHPALHEHTDILILTGGLGTTARSPWGPQPRLRSSWGTRTAGVHWLGSPRCLGQSTALLRLCPRGTCWVMLSFGAEGPEHGHNTKKKSPCPNPLTALHFFCLALSNLLS